MFIKIKVKPSSGKQEIEKISESQYLVHLKSPAEDNKANVELVKLLQKYFHADAIKIKLGLTSKNKLIEVKDGKSA